MPDKPTETDLLPMSYHIDGAPHRGNHVRVVRVSPTGDDKDTWMTLAGGSMVFADGNLYPAVPWHGLRAPLKKQAGHTLEEAVKLGKRAARTLGT